MLYLLRPGEYTIKTPHIRKQMEERLIKNLRDLFNKNDVPLYNIYIEPGRIFIESTEKAKEILKFLYGIKSFSPVHKIEFKDIEDLSIKSYEFFKDKVKDKEFAVRVHRKGKHSFTSLDVARKVGELLLNDAKKVNLENPEVECFIEIRDNVAYLFTEIIEGPGGLPVGVEGRALALYSSGFDSIAASYLMLKRGFELDFLFFDKGDKELLDNVIESLKFMKKYFLQGYQPILYVVKYKDTLSFIAKEAKEYTCILCKRTMLKVAERIVRLKGYLGIITGDSLGQVASQTGKNLFIISEGIKVPVYRPLIGFDKDESIKIVTKVGMFDFAKKESKKVCPFLPKEVVARGKLEVAREIENRINLNKIVNKLLKNIEIIRI